MKRLIYILFLVFIGQISFAQQLPLYSQYLYNKYLINPAVAGSDGYTSINITAREQWVGLDGAPETFSLSMQGRFLKRGYFLKRKANNQNVVRPKTDGRTGLGGSIYSHKSGLLQRTGFQFSYSHHIWLQRNTQLSLGLSFTGYYFNLNEKKLSMEYPDDPILHDNLRHGIFVPDASFGVYILNRHYNIGFSTDQLFGASMKLGNEAYSKYNMYRHYYLFGSYSFEHGREFELRPSLLLKMSDQIRPQADIGLNFVYTGFTQHFWLGLTYRTAGMLIPNIGVKYEKFYIGYALDYSFKKIQNVTYGTHEVVLAVKFGASDRKFRWLDRY